VEPFFKYHGLGNDFVVLDRRGSGVDVDEVLTRAVCDRHFGVGADGVLAVLPSHRAAARMVVHNADGSVAEMCGNGLRCVVKHLADADPSRPSRLEVETGAGVLPCELEWAGAEVALITVAMGQARLEAPGLPDGGPFVARSIEGVVGTAVSMGNPHLVLLDTPHQLAASLGPTLERHPLFPHRTNVEFVRALEGGGLDVVVWERGVGLTLACGTGACAAVVASVLAGRAPPGAWVPVRLPGGRLEIKVQADLGQVWLRGEARRVFQGVLP
jgi:diaminopimelate epimerase